MPPRQTAARQAPASNSIIPTPPTSLSPTTAATTKHSDYRAIPELDQYDAAVLADENEEVEEMSPGARAKIEQEMRKRDRATARGRTEGRGRDVLDRFADDDDEGDDDDDVNPLARRNRRRLAERAAGVGGDGLGFQEDLDETIIENLEDRKGYTLREWIVHDPVNREIYKRFRKFLIEFVDEEGMNVHIKKIKAMAEANEESLVVSYTDLCTQHPVLAIFVADVRQIRHRVWTISHAFLSTMSPPHAPCGVIFVAPVRIGR